RGAHRRRRRHAAYLRAARFGGIRGERHGSGHWSDLHDARGNPGPVFDTEDAPSAQCLGPAKEEGTMSDQRYRVDRRRFLRDSALVSLGIVAAACAPGTTTTGGGTAKKGGEFHAAWPWVLPPAGHYNYLNSSAILSGSYLTDFFIPSLAVYRWADANWENWLNAQADPN